MTFPKYTLENIPDGYKGTRCVLKRMAFLVSGREGKTHPAIRSLAVDLASQCPQKHLLCEIVQIHRFVRDDIRYIKDIDGVETLHSPLRVLQYRAGDCDDKTILTSALLAAIGFKVRIVAVGPPGIFCHVLPEVFLYGKWVPLETTEPVKPGWYPKNYTNRMLENI